MKMKTIFRFAGICLIMLAVSSLWFASCASESKSASTDTATGAAKQAEGGAVAQTDKWEKSPAEVLDFIIIDKPLYGFVDAYGYNGAVPIRIKGSVIACLFEDLNIHKDTIVPLDPSKARYAGQTADDKQQLLNIEKEKIIRSGMIKPANKYIIYHDTENNNAGSDAFMHTRYMRSSANNRARSWHYTVDDSGIWQTIPDNEVAWQGDCYESYAYSIGIETCVNRDNDLFLIWQRAAKLIAYLLDLYGLTPDAVKQHYEIMELAGMTGKDCPKTLRHAGLWETAKHLMICEYIYLQSIVKNGYKAEFISESPEYIDGKGRIVTLPPVETEIKYIVRITGHDNGVWEKRHTLVFSPAGFMNNFVESK